LVFCPVGLGTSPCTSLRVLLTFLSFWTMTATQSTTTTTTRRTAVVPTTTRRKHLPYSRSCHLPSVSFATAFSVWASVIVTIVNKSVDTTTAFVVTTTTTQSCASYSGYSSSSQSKTALFVSELHIPGYAQSKLAFILQDGDLNLDDGAHFGAPTLRKVQPRTYSAEDSTSLIPHHNDDNKQGHLLHRSRQPVFTSQECQQIVQEAEFVASQIAWTTNRHGNFPTTGKVLDKISPYNLHCLLFRFLVLRFVSC
jgi:hypothetical protein